MVKKVIHDPLFLAQKSVDATEADKQIVTDLLDTLRDNLDRCVGMAAIHELPIMVPIAFLLEFFVVGKIAGKLAFSVMRPDDRPQFITYAVSICICCIMCPIMSLVATSLFKDHRTFGVWVQTWGMNFPMAICYQMFYCGPFVRFVFRMIFKETEETECIPEVE